MRQLGRRVLVVLLGAAAMALPAAADDWHETMEAFISDGALPELSLPEGSKPCKPPKEWKDTDVVCVALSKGSLPKAGYILTDSAGQRVLDFMAPWPIGPVPMQEMPRGEAEKTAQQFAQRRLPELFAAAGEVECVPEPQISPYDAYLFKLQRIQQRVQVPTWARVGVRVYDGKVVSWRAEHQPVTIDLSGGISVERAQQIAAENMPWESFEPVMWLEATNEVVHGEDGKQHNVWTIWAEIKTKNTKREWTLERLCRWQIDATSGEVLSREPVKPDGELYWWYVSKGGEHWPSNGRPTAQSLFNDTNPVFSPDGQRIAFLSTRPRPGYPPWHHQPMGLFFVNLDGSGLSCLVPGTVQRPCWSPDGARIGYLQDGDIVVLNAGNGSSVTLPAAEERVYTRFVWLPSGKIAAADVKYAADERLLLLDPGEPGAEPVELPIMRPRGGGYADLMADERGRLVVATWGHFRKDGAPDPRRAKARYCMWVLAPVAPQSGPQVLIEYLSEGRRLQPAPGGRILISAGADQWLMADPEAGTCEPWRAPLVLLPGVERRLSVHYSEGITFSPDKTLMALSGYYWNQREEDPAAHVIYICRPDGSEPRLLTQPAADVTPSYVFPATGKPAFEAPKQAGAP